MSDLVLIRDGGRVRHVVLNRPEKAADATAGLPETRIGLIPDAAKRQPEFAGR